jgi:hypothetical protein
MINKSGAQTLPAAAFNFLFPGPFPPIEFLRTILTHDDSAGCNTKFGGCAKKGQNARGAGAIRDSSANAAKPNSSTPQISSPQTGLLLPCVLIVAAGCSAFRLAAGLSSEADPPHPATRGPFLQ